jgi:PAS domain S-box-containing protein
MAGRNEGRKAFQRRHGGFFARIPLAVALVYALASAGWIVFSDRLLVSLAGGYSRYQELQTWKGTFFICLSALLIYLFLQSAWRGVFSAYSAAVESEHRLELALTGADGGIWEMNLLDADDRIAFVSPRFATRFGLAPGEGISAAELGAITHPDDIERARHSFQQFLAAGTDDTFDICYRIKARDGSYRWLQSRGSILSRSGGKVERMAGVSFDVTERFEAEERVRQLLRYDPVTGLARQRSFIRSLDAALVGARKEFAGLVKVKIAGLEDFISDNETVEDAGIVQMIGDRLKRFAERGVVSARLEASVFAFATPLMPARRAVHALVREVLADLAEPFEVEGGAVRLRCHAGGTLFPHDGRTGSLLLRNCRHALAKAEKAADTNIIWFTEGLDTEFRTRNERLRNLGDAVVRGEIECHFQPVVDLATGTAVGFEALARWRMKGRGFISPDQFIPLAEGAGLISELGEEILRQACRTAAGWAAAFEDPPFVAVNVSPVQLADPAFPVTVARVLAETGLAPGRLELEITENAFITDPELTARRLEVLRRLGISIAIDDFGTGYSSLALLTRLPFTRLKVDRSFIRDYGENRENTVIVNMIIALCRHLDLSVTVEGVETPETAGVLASKGVMFAQGYLFSKPVPAAEARRLIGRKWPVAPYSALAADRKRSRRLHA